MPNETDEQRRSEHCNNGAQHYVCSDCRDKYSTRPPYDGTVTVHNGTCYICKEPKIVGPSRKLFGFHIFM